MRRSIGVGIDRRYDRRCGAIAWRYLEMPCRQSTLQTLLGFAAVVAASQVLIPQQVLAPHQALAQQSVTSNETFKTMIGKWEISNADRDRTCHLTFKADPSGTLFKLEFDKTCPVQMPELKDVTGWTIGGLDLVKLTDGKGKPIF